MRFLIVSLLLGATLFSQLGYAKGPNGSEIRLYGGVTQAISAPQTVFFNTIYPEWDSLEKDSNSGYGFTGGFGFAHTMLKNASNAAIIQSISVGLDFYVFNTSITGDVLQFGSPELNNLNYNFDINTVRLMLDGELNFHPLHQLIPFITAGLGASNNNARYYDVANINGALLGGSVTLPSQTYCAFAYSFGAGFKVPLSQKMQLSLRYLYTDMGKAQTDTAPAPYLQGVIEPVSMRLRTQAGLLGFTYLLD